MGSGWCGDDKVGGSCIKMSLSTFWCIGPVNHV